MVRRLGFFVLLASSASRPAKAFLPTVGCNAQRFTSTGLQESTSPWGVDTDLTLALQDRLNVVAPNSIQAEALPLALEGKDVVIVAQTGSGKTLTFLLPILQKMRGADAHNPDPREPRALVLAPTDLLLGQHKYVAEKILTGSSGILFSTPANLLKLLAANEISLDHVETIAIDEVDAVLYEDDKATSTGLLDVLPQEAQYILTTAFLTPEREKALLRKDFPDAELIQEKNSGYGRMGVLVPTLRQTYKYFSGDKEEKLVSVIQSTDEWLSQGSTIVFCGSVESAEQIRGRIASTLETTVDVLHENLPQETHNSLIAGLRKKEENDQVILVCTDLAARGLDVPNIRHVILYDVPTDMTSFIHQVGRTARRGQQGLVTCLVKTGSADYRRFSHLHSLKDATKLEFASSETTQR